MDSLSTGAQDPVTAQGPGWVGPVLSARFRAAASTPALTLQWEPYSGLGGCPPPRPYPTPLCPEFITGDKLEECCGYTACLWPGAFSPHPHIGDCTDLITLVPLWHCLNGWRQNMLLAKSELASPPLPSSTAPTAAHALSRAQSLGEPPPGLTSLLSRSLVLLQAVLGGCLALALVHKDGGGALSFEWAAQGSCLPAPSLPNLGPYSRRALPLAPLWPSLEKFVSTPPLSLSSLCHLPLLL